MVKLTMVLNQRCYFKCRKGINLFDFEFTKQGLVAGTRIGGNKRGELFIRAHNEPLFIVPVRINDPDCPLVWAG